MFSVFARASLLLVAVIFIASLVTFVFLAVAFHPAECIEPRILRPASTCDGNGGFYIVMEDSSSYWLGGEQYPDRIVRANYFHVTLEYCKHLPREVNVDLRTQRIILLRVYFDWQTMSC
jgi:hypothetical protein